MQADTATVGNSMEVPQKIKKIESPYDPVIPLLGTYPKKMETLIQKDISPPVYCNIIYNSQAKATT